MTYYKVDKRQNQYYKDILDKGLVWQDELMLWCRRCPICNSIIKSKSRFDYVAKSVINNRKCYSCSNKKHHSKETIQKITLSQKGRKLTDEHKRKLSIAARTSSARKISNQIRTESFRKKISIKFKKRILNSEWRRKLRKAKLERFEQLGIASCEDKGANEFFSFLNSMGYDFKSTVFKEIGYVADGYDKFKHIWIEYDTPYHNRPHQVQKDIIRENNIINYYKTINHPVSAFIRVKNYNKLFIGELKYVGNESYIKDIKSILELINSYEEKKA